MSERLVELTLKKGTIPNRVIRSLFRVYRGEEPPQFIDACKTLWVVIVCGTLMKLFRIFAAMPASMLWNFFRRNVPVVATPVGKTMKVKIVPVVSRGARASWKKTLPTFSCFGKILWLFLWPIRKLFLVIVFALIFICERIDNFKREHYDGCELTLGVAGILFVLGAIVFLLYSALATSWFWTLVAFVSPPAAIGLVVILYLVGKTGFFGFVWNLLVAVKHKFCPLIRVE